MKIRKIFPSFKDHIIPILVPFLTSRLLVLFIFFITQSFVNIGDGKIENYFYLNGHVNLLDFLQILNSNSISKGDINWYHDIVMGGYSEGAFDSNAQTNWAFFPGFPILWNLFSLGSKGSVLSGILLSNFLFLCALIGIRKIFLKLGCHREVELSLWLLCIYPFSYFFSLPMSESLFLLCSTWFIVLLIENKTWLTFSIGILAGLTRSNAIFLSLVPWTLYFWHCIDFSQSNKSDNSKMQFRLTMPPKQLKYDLIRMIIASASPIVGLLLFMYHLYIVSGNPLAFKDIQSSWGRASSIPFLGFFQAITKVIYVSEGANFRLFNIVAILLMTASTLYLFRWGIKNLIENNIAKSALLISLAIYMGLNIYLFTSAGGEMVSTMRFFSCMFPTFFVGGKFLSAFPNLIMPITIICAVLLGAFSALFIIGFNAVVA